MIPFVLVNLVITVDLIFMINFYEVVFVILILNDVDALASDLCSTHAKRPLPNIHLTHMDAYLVPQC